MRPFVFSIPLIIGTGFIALFYYAIFKPLKFVFTAIEKNLEEKEDEEYD